PPPHEHRRRARRPEPDQRKTFSCSASLGALLTIIHYAPKRLESEPSSPQYEQRNAPAAPVASKDPWPSRLAELSNLRGVVFDDQVRLHLLRVRHVGQLRHTAVTDRETTVAQFQIVRQVTLGRLLGFQHQGHVARLFLDLD